MIGRQGKMSRAIAALIIAVFGALVVAIAVPLAIFKRPADRTIFGDSVEASAANVITIDQPLQLSAAPAITVTKGMFYAGARAQSGARNLVLDNPFFEVDLAARMRDVHDLAEATGNALVLPLYQQLSALGFESVDIKRGELRIRWAGGIEETLSGIDARLTPRKNGLLAVEGGAVVRGQLVKIEGTVGPPSRSDATRTGARAGSAAATAGQRSWPLRLTVRGPDLFARIEGTAANDDGIVIEGNADVSIPRVANVLRWHGIGWPPSAAGISAATLRGPMTWRSGAVSFQSATFSVDGQEGTGALTFRYRDGRPMIEGTVAVESLNAAPLLRTSAGTAIDPNRREAWADAATSLPAILAVDADVRLSAKRLFIDATPLGRAVAAFTVRDAIMHADIADLDLGALRGSVQVTADMSKASPAYSVRGRFEAQDSTWLTEPLLAAALPPGKVAGTIEFTGTGPTVGDILRGAHGKLALTMPDGGKLPLDLRALRTAVQTTKAREIQGWGVAAVESAFDEIDLKSQIEPGRLVIDRLTLKSKSLTATATGTIARADKDVGIKVMLGTPAAIARSLSAQRAAGASSATAKTATGADPDLHILMIRGPIAAPAITSIDKAPAP